MSKMKVSNEQIASVLAHGGAVTQDTAVVDAANIRLMDRDLIESVVEKVKQMPDRNERIAELKAQIEAGTYNPSADDIADTMVRRAIADRIR
ncbi:MAG: flagellar biosynthesis anti-sigma factor FlgM [Armatimonadota bacterium]